ncbi:MAG TPA: nucleoside-diphosphate sugar epimerase/dehydratase [Bryobacteraceae bacterium]|nr:nucleoside-diphosphate sugar epimerase/dehydratase [Bryobacteraceae bacterium]
MSMRLLRKLSTLTSGELGNGAKHVGALYAVQLLLALTAGVTAFLLRFDFAIPSRMGVCFAFAIATWLIVKPASLYLFGGTHAAWRYFSTPDLIRVLAANVVGVAIAAAVLILFCPVRCPLSILIIDALTSLLLNTGVRAGTRLCFELCAQRQGSPRVRTFIYGAGQAGVMLLQEARNNREFAHEICGFIDDAKHAGLLLQGVRVLGAGPDLKRLAAEHRVSEILIAVPSADGAAMTRIAQHCRNAGVAFKTMPPLSEILSGRSLTTQLRDVALEDLLGRTSVKLDNEKIRTKIEGQVVLVSGAAGSIGSELCRQIARFRPAGLVAFEISETALFFLEREMRHSFPDLHFCPEIGSIQNMHRLREVFGQYRPSLVLHAAAYKHVPLMERHLFEAVENNVFGTYNLAAVSAEWGVQDFVMISSDKAVNPTNIMGATKRVAELMIRSFPPGGPRYVSVRFGNVLGSNGSVIPIFKQQIAAGGPVTITHPEIERFFMTIPEASQLVLQACTMGRGGEVFVLDMGKPVKILDLATQLIQLSGLELGRDIQIKFTGLRPGEKMYEELSLPEEDMLPTRHSKIKVFAGTGFELGDMRAHLQRLRKACEHRNAKALVRELKTIVPDYTASQDVMERAFTDNLITLDRVLRIAPAAGEPVTTMQASIS